MSVDPTSQRRHAAARSRTVTALLSVGGFLGIIGSLAASRTAASTSTASTAPPNVPVAPAPVSTTLAPVASTNPPTSNNQGSYGGTPARSFNRQPVTRSHASR